LAEAVAAELLPGERATLHERIAGALETARDETLAAEAAGHWAAAGRATEELRARLTAANAAEQAFAYADAATHWQRAIELCQAEPGADLGDGLDMARLYIRAVDALEASGNEVRAGAVAEEAYLRFADHPDLATAALVHFRAGLLRASDSIVAGLPLMEEALRLFEGTGPSVEHAKAWYWYATLFLHGDARRPEEVLAALRRALEVAEATSAPSEKALILSGLAQESFRRGEVEEGFRLLAQGLSGSEESRDAWSVLALAGIESDALLKVGRLEAATRVGLRGIEGARQGGLGSNFYASVNLANAVDGLLSRGHTAEAAALIDPHTAGPVDQNQWLLRMYRAESDFLHGAVDEAAQRLDQTKVDARFDASRELAQRVAEVAVWVGRPGDALRDVRQELERLEGTEWVIFCGWPPRTTWPHG
jgi:tetratricopeptide (TPR) repeat protein